MFKVRNTEGVADCKTFEIVNEVPGKRPRSGTFVGIGSGVLVSADYESLTLRRDDARDLADEFDLVEIPEGLVVAEIGNSALGYLNLEQIYYASSSIVRNTSQEALLTRGARLRDELKDQGKSEAAILQELRSFLEAEQSASGTHEAIMRELKAQMNTLFESDYVRIAVNALRNASGKQIAPTAENILDEVVIQFGHNPYLMSHDELKSFAGKLRAATEKRKSIWDKV